MTCDRLRTILCYQSKGSHVPKEAIRSLFSEHLVFTPFGEFMILSIHCVANAGLLIPDGVGKYILPSNHSVLNDRCQFGSHGEACERMGRT